MRKTKRYDYVFKIDEIRFHYAPERGHAWRRILRGLVRTVVAECRESAKHEALDADYADRIAKELVP